MNFTGIPAAALDFYEELEADNTRTFWQANKQTYDVAVRAPMAALLALLEPEFGTGQLFRPYRDVRFSKDKSPYKTHQGAFVAVEPSIGYYVHVDPAGLLVAGGFHSHAPDQVERYRTAVDDERRGGQLARIANRLTTEGFVLDGDRLKTRPRGIPEDHPRLELLRYRSLTADRRFGFPDWLHTPEAADQVRTAWRALRPLVDWVTTHVGPSDNPSR